MTNTYVASDQSKKPSETALVLCRHFRTVLLLTIFVLACLHSTVMFCWVNGGCGALNPVFYDYGSFFDVNKESNVPTWFSIMQLVLLSALCVLAALWARTRGYATWPWWGLAVLFFYISLDESTDLHGFWALTFEGDAPLEFGVEGFNWIYVGSALVVSFGLIYLRWLLRLPRYLRVRIVLAGCVFVLGGLVFEVIGGLVGDDSWLNPAYLAASLAEEVFEMAGITLMLDAVLTFLVREGATFRFSAGSDEDPTADFQ